MSNLPPSDEIPSKDETSKHKADTLLPPIIGTADVVMDTPTFHRASSPSSPDQQNTDNIIEIHSNPEPIEPISPQSTNITPSSSTENITKYQVYRTRWWIMFLYCLGNCVNSIVWITYAPITTITSQYYNITKTQVNLITTIYSIVYLFATCLSTYVYHKYDIRTGLIWGSGLTIFTWLRCFSVINPTSSNGITWLVIGALFPAFGQPFFTNAPAMIAAQWFAPEQRDIATTIASMANPLGIAIGQLIPTAIVSNDGTGMFYLHLVESILTTVAFILIILFFKSYPPTPPSYATAKQWELRKQDHHRTTSVSNQNSLIPSVEQHSSSSHITSPSQQQSQESPSFQHTLQLILRDYAILMKNKQFLILLVAFGIGLGMFNSLSTLIEQYITPAGYNTDDAGLCGAFIILFGFLGAGIFGAVLDKTHQYKNMLKLIGTCVFGSCCFVVFGLQPNQTAVVYASFGVLGFFIMPLLPIVFETAVECTYPIAEESSNGLLMLSGMLVGIPVVFILDYTISLRPTYNGSNTPTNIILLVLFGIACTLLWFYNGPYLRLQAEKIKNQQDINNKDMEQSAIAGSVETSVAPMNPEKPVETTGSGSETSIAIINPEKPVETTGES